MLSDLSGTGGSFDAAFRYTTEKFFAAGNQTTALAYHGGEPVGCATICYINLMPTISHPTGKRAHFMNVYTRHAYRRLGIAKRMMEQLIAEAKELGVSHISLDATEKGRQLYRKLGLWKPEREWSLLFNKNRGAGWPAPRFLSVYLLLSYSLRLSSILRRQRSNHSISPLVKLL